MRDVLRRIAGLLLRRDGGGWRSGLCSRIDADSLAAVSSAPVDGGDSGRALGRNLAAAADLGGLAIALTAVAERRTRHDPASVAGSCEDA